MTAANLINDGYPRVNGEPLESIPKDIYIPLNALSIEVDCFEGPLDLLLYLIRNQNIDILDIPIAEISRQYMNYINLMQVLQLELAADYLAMAATLAEIKSQLLLPKPELTEAEEHSDPRADLIRHLRLYEQYKEAALALNALEQQGRDFFLTQVQAPDISLSALPFECSLDELVSALIRVQSNLKFRGKYQIPGESLTTSKRIAQIITLLAVNQVMIFQKLIIPEEGRIGIAVTFNAILELERQSLILTTQAKPFDEIKIKYLPEIESSSNG